MSNDDTIQVKFGAQIQGLLEGMGKAQESVKSATEGMSGDIAKMAETFETMGVAALGLAAVGLAFEGIKKSIEYVQEAIKETNELAESFRNLGYATGASVTELNGYLAAMEMSGGNMGRLDSLMTGMQRGIKANSDVLIANGVAANKAALDGMSFESYLRRVSEIADQMATPTERTQFLILALGRGAAMSGAQLKEFVEHLEEGKKLTQDGGPVSDKSLSNLKATEEATGRLNTALKTNASLTAGAYSQATIAYTNWRADAVTWSNKVYDAQSLAARGLIQYQFQADGVTVSIEKLMAAAQKYHEMERSTAGDMANELRRAQQADEAKNKPEKKTLVTKTNLEDEKKAADAAQKLAEQTMLGQVAAAKQAFQAKKDALNQSVADEATTKLEALAQEKAAVMTESAAELAAVNARIGKLKTDDVNYAAEFAKLQNEKKAIVAATEHQIAELTLKGTQEQAKARTDLQKRTDEADKEIAAMAKETAREETQVAKDGLATQTAALNQKVLTTRMSAQQELAARVQLRQQTAMLEVQALTQEQQREGISTADWQKLQNKKLDAARQNSTKISELEAQSLAKQRAQWEGFFGSMTGGFSKSITGLIHGTMTWGEAFKNVLSSALDGIVNFFVQWGIQEAIKWATSLAMQKTSSVAEATGAAAVYAVNAMASAAAIPVYGWAMAPGVGAEAYSSGLSMAAMASAAGGWDRVPSDQVAQIHKNEMVMSAPLATGIRDLVTNGQAGGSGGGDAHLHLHGNIIDTHGVKKFFNDNQGALLSSLGRAGRNGRVS